MKYPDDANGDTLRRMEVAGDDLTRSRETEFTVVFPNQNTARVCRSRLCAWLNSLNRTHWNGRGFSVGRHCRQAHDPFA